MANKITLVFKQTAIVENFSILGNVDDALITKTDRNRVATADLIVDTG